MPRRKKRSDGLYQKKFTVDIKGVRKQFCVYGHSEKELLEKEKTKRLEIEQGLLKINNPTLTDFYLQWIEGRRGTVKEATIRIDEKAFGVVKMIKIPELSNICFGDIRIKEIDIEVLRTVQKALCVGRKTRTVNDYMAIIKHILIDAQKYRVIDYNPSVLLKDLKRVEERAQDTYHRALTHEEQKAFFGCERYKNSPYKNILLFALLTACRIGEIAALKYSDIKDGMIHINRTITRSESGSYLIGDDAKTEAGRRSIPITDQVAKVIEDQKMLNLLKFGGVTSIDDRLFKAVEGGILRAGPVDREIKRICKAAGIKPITAHALRATWITRAWEAGVSEKTITTTAGHKSISTSMKIYISCHPDIQRKEIESIKIVI